MKLNSWPDCTWWKASPSSFLLLFNLDNFTFLLHIALCCPFLVSMVFFVWPIYDFSYSPHTRWRNEWENRSVRVLSTAGVLRGSQESCSVQTGPKRKKNLGSSGSKSNFRPFFESFCELILAWGGMLCTKMHFCGVSLTATHMLSKVFLMSKMVHKHSHQS